MQIAVGSYIWFSLTQNVGSDLSVSMPFYAHSFLMLTSLIFSFLASTVSSLPLEQRDLFPQVTINDGTVKGSSLLGVDSFKGIPFAQPPVGELRLKAPLPLNSSYGTISAIGVPAACPQFYAQVQSQQLLSNVLGTLLNTPLLQAVTSQNEDCLTVNVQRPSDVDPNVKLPVLFWIFGGGFELGGSQQYDGTSIVQRSIANGEPVIFVAVNYR
jgi:carboxylesterase type B